MRSDRLAGLEADYALFASLPDTAKEELKSTLDAIARDVLAVQQNEVAVGKTGKLKAALTIAEELERLRVRVGLPQLKGKSDLFYGVVVEKGRSAGQKLVQRRRRVGGKLRLSRRRKRLEDIEATYLARWTALPARPFVHVEAQVDGKINARLDGFWNRTLGRAGA